MKVVVLGATGTIGKKIAKRLSQAGHEVVGASRSTGIDAFRGKGLAEALSEANVVIDCLNIETLSKKKAVKFFSTTTRTIVKTAQQVGLGHIVCVGIAEASNTKVNAFNGYYQGKAVQEQIYRNSGLPTTLIYSTQWFELIDDLVRRASLGPVTVLPSMKMAPVAADSVARLVADHAAAAPPAGVRDVTIRGPEIATGRDIAREILAVRGSVGDRRPRFLTHLPFLGKATASGGLIPTNAIIDDTTLRDWLQQGSGAL